MPRKHLFLNRKYLAIQRKRQRADKVILDNVIANLGISNISSLTAHESPISQAVTNECVTDSLNTDNSANNSFDTDESLNISFETDESVTSASEDDDEIENVVLTWTGKSKSKDEAKDSLLSVSPMIVKCIKGIIFSLITLCSIFYQFFFYYRGSTLASGSRLRRFRS